MKSILKSYLLQFPVMSGALMMWASAIPLVALAGSSGLAGSGFILISLLLYGNVDTWRRGLDGKVANPELLAPEEQEARALMRAWLAMDNPVIQSKLWCACRGNQVVERAKELYRLRRDEINNTTPEA